MVLSQSSSLFIAASVFGTIWIGFGINAIIRPESALEPFEFSMPRATADRRLVENLMIIYGVRDIFAGLAIYATAYTRDRRALGAILIAGSGLAFVDGLVCYREGKGHWNHFSYAPLLTIVGSLLLGIFDRA